MESFDNALDQYLNNLKEKGETAVTPQMDNVIKPAEERRNEYFDEDEEVFSVEADNEDYPVEEYIKKDEIEYIDDYKTENNNKFAEGEEILPVSEVEDINEDESNNDDDEEEDNEEDIEDNHDTDKENDNNDNNENTENNDFNDVDEGELLDVNDPLLYTENDTDTISFDELNESNENKTDDEDFDSEPKAKKSFKDLNNIKKKFEPGRLNKNNMMIAILGFLFIVFAGFIWANRNQEKKRNTVNEEEDYLAIDGYKPDFGDYKNRAYKQENIPGNEEASEKINKILFEGEKEKYENPSKENENKGQTGYYGNNNQSVSTAQSSGGNPANDLYKERVESGLRKNINDYTDYSNSGSGYNTGGQGTPIYNTANNGNYAQDYFDQLNSISGALGAGKNNNSANQSASLRFTDAGRYDKNASGGDISYIPENSIYPGTIIHAVLVSGINTDYPGAITARVINNVYDSKTGKTLLIPSGSILRGSYSSSSIGISRIQIAWQTLIINRNGVDYSVNLGSMVGVDSKGYSGIKGSLNDHAFAYLKAAGISCLFTFINSNIFTVTQKQKSRTTQQMIEESQDIGNKLADKILDRALDIQPTVTVKNGTRISVDVDKVLTLYPFERDMPVQKYKR